ncbi:MAG: carbamoylphosphate synthase large subunit [Chloroflexota bacterium]
MPNLLLTGGRSPACLELARLFQRAGHTVYMAESLRGHLSAPSRAIAQNFLVPPPRQQPAAYLSALAEIVQRQRIDLVIPANEETFHVARGRGRLPVFTESLPTLRSLHNKWDFIRLAASLGLSVPETALLQTQDDLLGVFARWRGLVLKPAFSRFASRTLILPTVKQALSALTVAPANPWVAQEFVTGGQVCTYSVVHGGRITAHTAYRSEFTAGQGATIAFQHVEHPAALAWVDTFVNTLGYTGQVSFDFIEDEQGAVTALECNPRATSGVHLLAAHPHFAQAFLDPALNCITPIGENRSMLGTAMLLYGLPNAIQKGTFKRWLDLFLSSRDTIFTWSDPLPAWLQTRSIFHYLRLARQQGISPLQASTFDIEWNGEDLPAD